MNVIDTIISVLLVSSIIVNILWIILHFWPKNRIYTIKDYPRLSIIFPAFNEGRNIEESVKAVLNLDYKGEMEVIVVNDGSTDNTGEVLEGMRKTIPELAVLRGNHAGKANAVNKAASMAVGDVIIVIDADSVVDKNALEEIVAPFSNPRIGAVSGAIRAVTTGNVLTWFQDFEYILTSNWRFIIDNVDGTYFLPGFVAFRRKAFVEIEGFSPDTQSEDFEIALRLRKAGWSMAMTHARIYTQVPKTIKHLIMQRMRWARGSIQSIRKHSEMLFNRRYGSAGVFGLPMQLYWIIYGAVSTPVSIFQIYQGYMTYFFSNGEYLSINTLKYFLNWFSVFGIVDYTYHVLSGIWEMTPVFPIIIGSFLTGLVYNILALLRMRGFDIKHIIVWCFFMVYWFGLTPFILYSVAAELIHPMRKYRREINVWEK